MPVLPDMSGFGPGIVKGAGQQVDSSGKLLGGRFGTAMLAGVAVVAGGIALAGRALYGIGETFDEVSDTIRVGTGATGEALEGLVESARNVGRNVPAEFEAIGTTIADLNTRMGLSGETLETVAAQYLEAGRILGEEVDIGTTSAAFNAFGVEGENVSESLDHLFRVSQATGIGMNELASAVQSNAPAVQALGFSFEETASLVGNLDRAGLNSSRMMMGMSQSLVRLAADGEAPADAFRRTVDEIDAFLVAGDDAAAIDLAGQVFGTRNATQFIGAIQNGTLAMDDLASVAGMTEDTILGAGEETMDFAEKWQMFKNDVLLKLEPIAMRVFDGMGNAMTWLTDTAFPALSDTWGTYVQPVIDGLKSAYNILFEGDFDGNLFGLSEDHPAVDFLFNLRESFMEVGDQAKAFWENSLQPAFREIADFVETRVGPVMTYLWNDVIKPAFAGISGYVNDTLVPALQDFGDRAVEMWEGFIEPTFTSIVGVIEDKVIPTVTDLWENVIKPAFTEIGDTIKLAWENVISPALSALTGFITDEIAPKVTWLWEEIIGPAFSGIGDFITDAWDNVIKPVFDAVQSVLEGDLSGAFQFLQDAVTGVWDTLGGLISDVWENVIKPVFNAMGGWIEDHVVPGIEAGVDAIGDAWDWLKRMFAAPINWVIRHVWNGGIVSIWNAVADVIGGTPLSEADELTWGQDAAVRRVSAPRSHVGAQRAYAEGGYAPPGWAWVGEEGPELVDFRTPGRVYTAAQSEALSRAMLGQDLTVSQGRAAAGRSPSEALLPMGDNVDGMTAAEREELSRRAGRIGHGGHSLGDAVDGAVQWVRGGLAATASALLNPVKSLITNTVGQWGRFGGLAGDASSTLIDGVIDWIRGEDEEYLAREMLAGGGDKFDVGVGGAGIAGGAGGWVRPGPGPVTSRFGPRWGGHHAGIDLAMPIGTPVRAAMAGTIIRNGWNTLAGRTGVGQMLRHVGWGSYYGHLSRAFGSPGMAVKQGDIIGLSGNTGNSTGPHLHFEVNRGNFQAPINPAITGVFDTGGVLNHGRAALNLSGKPEAVLTNDQWQMLESFANTGRNFPESLLLRVGEREFTAYVEEISHGEDRAYERVGGAWG